MLITIRRLVVLGMILALVGSGRVYAGEKTTLTILSHAYDQVQIEEQFGKWAADRNIELEFIKTAATGDGGTVEKVLTMVAAGTAPDIIGVAHLHVVDLGIAGGGVLEDLQPWAFREGIALNDVFFEQAVESFSPYNGTWAFPVDMTLHVMFINRSKFDEAGVAHPPEDWNSTDWTWDEFVDASRRFTIDRSGDGRPNQFGIQTLGNWDTWLWTFGLQWFSDDMTTYLGGTPPVIDALTNLTDLYTVYNAIGGDFGAGTAAMRDGAAYYQQTAEASGVDWAVAPYPLGAQRAVIFLPNGISMAKDSKNKEAAWEFIQYVTLDPEGASLWLQMSDRLPTSTYGIESFRDIQLSEYGGKNLNVWMQAPEYMRLSRKRLAGGRYQPIQNLLTRAWNSVIRDRTSDVANAFREIEQPINVHLREWNEYVSRMIEER